jgi:hypothetical protein
MVAEAIGRQLEYIQHIMPAIHMTTRVMSRQMQIEMLNHRRSKLV